MVSTGDFDPSCPLCGRERRTEWLYEDERVWVAYCATHRNSPMIVLKRHTATPSEEEMEYIRQIADRLFPGQSFRGPASIPGHYHAHF